jgi:hypothetical protein
MPSPQSPCVNCARKNRFGGWPPTCAAFPEGIPEPILLGLYDHTKPYAGDGGLTCSVAADAPAAVKRANKPIPSR